MDNSKVRTDTTGGEARRESAATRSSSPAAGGAERSSGVEHDWWRAPWPHSYLPPLLPYPQDPASDLTRRITPHGPAPPPPRLLGLARSTATATSTTTAATTTTSCGASLRLVLPSPPRRPCGKMTAELSYIPNP
ncbi:hypothetical protein E2C01_022084 [Portunus trituberculatus]|uniref:Uncharacterized protein n=1 Tax=Portunus trituberculatus TaxID=210409 RepID=A0A5B7E498_PORTR|nr:hypothetical protein [Portunus trituberculatus]